MSLPADFVLPVDKPEGPTSHDVVSMVRRRLVRRRVGHTGTLDPFASGLLLVCVGRATRLAEYLSGLDKTYEAVARLGVRTDTHDRDGDVIGTSDSWRAVTTEALHAALGPLRGEILQAPPIYSAKKVGGEAAHRRVRRGEEVQLATVKVTVHELAVTSLGLPDVFLRVRCSSGTYVRALARDLGEALGVGAHLVSLRRTAIGTFDVGSALPVEALADEARLGAALIDPLEALGHLPTVAADREEAALLAHGRALEGVDQGLEGLVAVAHEGVLLAVAESSDGVLRPRKVFAS